MITVTIAGPPRSGKTQLAERIKRALTDDFDVFTENFNLKLDGKLKSDEEITVRVADPYIKEPSESREDLIKKLKALSDEIKESLAQQPDMETETEIRWEDGEEEYEIIFRSSGEVEKFFIALSSVGYEVTRRIRHVSQWKEVSL